MSHLQYSTINLSKEELIIVQDLISKERQRLSNIITHPSSKASLTNICQKEYQICRDLNFVLKTELQKY